MKKKLAIVGAGSAGIQSLCHFLYWLPNFWEITLIYDSTIPSLGIGESTNGVFPPLLEKALDFELADMAAIDATNKFGTIYKRWRGEDFMGPLVVGSHAYHFNTHKLKDFAIPRLHQRWGSKFKEISGKMEKLVNDIAVVELTVDGVIYEYDYVINCSGFPKDFTGYELFEDHTVNHGLIHNIAGDYSHVGYTGHIATRDGWMFEVPLQSRMSYGYMFNDRITPVDEAKHNFSKEIGVDLDKLDDIEYNFTSYIKRNIIDGRVLYNGNQAFFFEPMFANSLMTYHNIDREFYDYIAGFESENKNTKCIEFCQNVRDTLYFKYHGGSTYDTAFWENAKKYKTNWLDSELCKRIEKAALINNRFGTETAEFDKTGTYSYFGFKKFDRYLGYDYFS
jgi:hypothetical protein